MTEEKKGCLHALASALGWRRESVQYKGAVLPSRRRREEGERKLGKKRDFLYSGEEEARRLMTLCELGPGKHVLDIGCGRGRLASGLIRLAGDRIHYAGVDVDESAIIWCRKNIGNIHPSYRFYHIDLANERYNPHGKPLDDSFHFDWPNQTFDIIYLHSVFSHMEDAHVRRYILECCRLLRPDGHLFFTAFVEEDVPSVSINPPGYAVKKHDGPLHVVRFDLEYLFGLLRECGFEIRQFDYGKEAGGQSALYLQKKKEPI